MPITPCLTPPPLDARFVQMADTFFRSTETASEGVSHADVEPNRIGAEERVEDIEPLDVREERNGDVLLEALGIGDTVENMPSEDKGNLSDVKTYIRDIVKARGMEDTVGSFKKVLSEVKADMGLDENADPATILDRVGGVIKAWKSLSFITDQGEKRRMFMKLAQMNNSRDMNKFVFEQMERYQVWR